MKKFSIIFCILVLFLSVQSFAIPKGPCDVKATCCDKAPPGPFAFSYPQDVGLACPRDFYTYGEFLLMKASEDGLDYGLTNTTAPAPPVIGEVVGFSSRSQEWDWRPGFRAGFGAYLNHDQWSMDATWTYIRIKADSQIDVENPNNIIAFFIPQQAPNIFQTLSARWSGDFNTMDISVGKPYHVSRYFVSHPMLGIRTAWIDQDFHVRHFSRPSLAKMNAFFKNDFWGVGLRALYRGEFRLGSDWVIFGKTAFSLLFGKFDVTSHSEPLISGGYSITESFYDAEPNVEFGLGVCWNKFFHKNQYRVSFNAAYEFHHWWDQNRLKYALNPFINAAIFESTKSDLSFNGFSFGLHLEF